jgi:hypothetical protein
LREALGEIRVAGLADAAKEVEDRCLIAFTTSFEFLGEVGEALTALLRAHGSAIPEPTRAKLRACLAEVAKVWPKYRP